MIQNAFLFTWECLHFYTNNYFVNKSKNFGNNCTQRFWTYLIVAEKTTILKDLRYWPSWLILWIHTINSFFKCTARVALIFITCIVASASAIALALKILQQSQFLPLKFVFSKSLSLLFSLACKMHTTWVYQLQLLFINAHSLSH